MDVGTIQAWASLLAAATGLAAIIGSFVLENRRRSDAAQDRLLAERRTAIAAFLAAASRLERQTEAMADWVRDPTGPEPDIDFDAYDLAENELQLVEPQLATAEGRQFCDALQAVVDVHWDWMKEAQRAHLRSEPPPQPVGMEDARSRMADAKAAFLVAAMQHIGTLGPHSHR